jgi:ankyrin repeat protein
LLISYNADVNTKTRDGKKPLDIAVERGHADMVRLLKQYETEDPGASSDSDRKTE